MNPKSGVVLEKETWRDPCSFGHMSVLVSFGSLRSLCARLGMRRKRKWPMWLLGERRLSALIHKGI